jgi:YYY domain-containing protein
LLAAATSTGAGVELVVVADDLIGTTAYRMNTVFKFYNQVWILLAIAAGAALGWLWPALVKARAALRIPWSVALVILVFLATLYPLLATRAKVEDRWAPGVPLTLDGMAFMPYAERYENGAVFTLQGDYDALRWLQENVQGTPVVLEAQTVEYNWGSRVAVYTGLPTVLGWNWHQRQQRPEQSAEVWQRVTDVVEAYNTTDVEHAMSLLRQYNVELVVVGDLERAYYNAEGLSKFDAMAQQGLLTLIYERDGTQIFQVVHDQEASS